MVEQTITINEPEVAENEIGKKDLDRFLLTRLKNGDESAFRHIFTRWEKPLFYFIRKITGSDEDSEDICQETFAVLWTTRGNIDPDKNIKTYIFLIAKQITWKLLRSARRREDFMSENGLEETSNLSPESIMQLKEMELLTDYAISKLPARTREIYNLYYKENMSYEQIAALLDTNAANIKAQVYQARQKIKDILAVITLILLG